jgi:hypothetical protein
MPGELVINGRDRVDSPSTLSSKKPEKAVEKI